MNLICDRALLAGYVQAPARDHARHGAPGRQGGRGRPAARAVALAPRPRAPSRSRLLLAALALPRSPPRAGARGRGRLPAACRRHCAGADSDARSPPPTTRGSTSSSRTLPRDASLASAAARVQAVWGGRPLARTTLRTQLDQLRAFDLPAVAGALAPRAARHQLRRAAAARRAPGPVAVGDEPLIEVPLAAARPPVDPRRRLRVARGARRRWRAAEPRRGAAVARPRRWASASPTWRPRWRASSSRRAWSPTAGSARARGWRSTPGPTRERPRLSSEGAKP